MMINCRYKVNTNVIVLGLLAKANHVTSKYSKKNLMWTI